MTSSCAAAGTLIISVVVLVVMGVFEVPMSRGDMRPSECKEEQRILINGCRALILGGDPSPNCCHRVKVTHVECLCPVITPQVAALIGVERTIKRIEGCGRIVPHNFTCGSITTP